MAGGDRGASPTLAQSEARSSAGESAACPNRSGLGKRTWPVVADRLDSVGRAAWSGSKVRRRPQVKALANWTRRSHPCGESAAQRNDARGGIAQDIDNRRAAFGQGRDGGDRPRRPAGGRLASSSTPSIRARPDCVIRLPGDFRLLAVDAKFPVEGLHRAEALRETRRPARRRRRACAQMSASTSRTSPSATSCLARPRTWR